MASWNSGARQDVIMKLHNKYYILRHGEALSNSRGVMSSWPEKFKNPLTEKGSAMIKKSAEQLKNLPLQAGKGIDLIFSSDLLRTKQTAEIVAKILNSRKFDKSSTTFKKIKVVLDKRLREINFGVLNGRPITDLNIDFSDETKRIETSMKDGETYSQVSERMWNFLQDLEEKYQGKNILIISHECPLWILESKVQGMTILEHLKIVPRDHRIHKGQVKQLN